MIFTSTRETKVNTLLFFIIFLKKFLQIGKITKKKLDSESSSSIVERWPSTIEPIVYSECARVPINIFFN